MLLHCYCAFRQGRTYRCTGVCCSCWRLESLQIHHGQHYCRRRWLSYRTCSLCCKYNPPYHSTSCNLLGLGSNPPVLASTPQPTNPNNNPATSETQGARVVVRANFTQTIINKDIGPIISSFSPLIATCPHNIASDGNLSAPVCIHTATPSASNIRCERYACTSRRRCNLTCKPKV